MVGDKVIVSVRSGSRIEDIELRVMGNGGSVELDMVNGTVRATTFGRKGDIRERILVGPEALVAARLVLRR